MRLLILTEEVWDDKRYPNNVMTNWFENFPGQLANLYLANGMPDNPCCSEYFQITDKMALGNLIRQKGGGKWFISKDLNGDTYLPAVIKETTLLQKVIQRTLKGILRLLRDAVWLRTNWEESMLRNFITEFRPDVIISLRFSSRRMLYMERLLHKMSGAPVIAFTGDDEYSLKQLSVSPFYWLRRFQIRSDIRRTCGVYKKYYTLSEQQAKELQEILGVNTGVLYKGGDFPNSLVTKKISKPIRIVYAGRLYCNRDKTLLALAAALATINRDEVYMTLEIYTRDTPGIREKKILDEGRSVFLRGFVSPEELKRIYSEADIALHVEGFDWKNRLQTRYSFSTKIVDCLASTCAVLAIGPFENEGIRYLKKNRGAICVGKIDQILPVLSHILCHSDKIELYRRNAWRLGVKAHRKEEVRQRLYEDITSIVEDRKVKSFVDGSM